MNDQKGQAMTNFRMISLLAMILTARPVHAELVTHIDEPWFDTVQVTFDDGTRGTLRGARFRFPGDDRTDRNYLSYHGAYLPMLQPTPYPRLLLIHSSKIIDVTFEPKGSALEIQATLDGDIVLRGEFAEPETELVGTGTLGEMTLKLKPFDRYGLSSSRKGACGKDRPSVEPMQPAGGRLSCNGAVGSGPFSTGSIL